MNELLGKYKNGNYFIEIYNDGTKIRFTKEDEFISSFPESIDMKITNNCPYNCLFCHENSTNDGKHGDILNLEFINTLIPFTEVAIGGGCVLTHPDLISFLELLKSKNIIANITVNQQSFMNDTKYKFIQDLIKKDLIKGLGVSLTNVSNEFINKIKQNPNTVIHIINGIVKYSDLEKLFNNDLKILILGYKEFRRGKDFYNINIEKEKQITYNNIETIIDNFKIVSFDNLAIEQLELRRLFKEKSWEQFYMGDDGKFTMYIDLVNKEFAKSSIANNRYDLLDNIEDMFTIVKNEKNVQFKQ